MIRFLLSVLGVCDHPDLLKVIRNGRLYLSCYECGFNRLALKDDPQQNRRAQ